MLRLTRLFLARPNAFQELLLRNRVVGFKVVSADACPRANKLADDPVRYCSLGDRRRKIDNLFPKARRSLLQIVNAGCIWPFANKRRSLITPKRILVPACNFGFRHSFV